MSKLTFIFLLTFAVGTAWGIDLTGTWEGKQVCHYFDGRERIVISNDVVRASQNGTDLFFSSEVVSGAIFHAQVIEEFRHSSTKAQAIFIECETNESSTYQELGRASKLQVISKGSAVWEATSNFYQEDPGEPRFMGTCSWNLRRVSTANPHTASCGAAALRIPQAHRQRPRKN